VAGEKDAFEKGKDTIWAELALAGGAALLVVGGTAANENPDRHLPGHRPKIRGL